MSAEQIHDIGSATGVGDLARRARGLHPRRLPPQLARRRGHHRGRPVRHQCHQPGDVHRAPARRLRRHAGAGRRPARPLRLARDAGLRAGADDRPDSSASPSPSRSRGAVLARAVVGAGDAMVFISVIRLVTPWFLVRQAPMVTQVTGTVRTARRDRCRRAAGLPPQRARLDPRLRADVEPGRGPARRGPRPGEGLALPARRGGRDQAAGPRAVGPHRLGQPRHPAGDVVPLRLAVLRHRLRAAVGLSVPGPGARLDARRRQHAADGDDGLGGGERPGPGAAGEAAALLPLVDRRRRGDRDGGAVDRGAAVAGRRAALAGGR